MLVSGIGTFIARILPGSNSKDWFDELADGLISDDTAEAVGGFSSASPLIACGAESDACQLTQGKPEAGDLDYDHDLVSASGTVTYGTPFTFILRGVEDCGGGSSNLSVTFKMGPYELPMTRNEEGDYAVTIPVYFWNGHVARAVIRDEDRGTEITRELYSLPNVVSDDHPYDVCFNYPSPIVHGDILNLDRNPTEIYVGDTVRIYFPSESIVQCDGISGADLENQLTVKFIVEAPTGRHERTAINDGNEFYASFAFSEEGYHNIYISEVKDSGHTYTLTSPYLLPSTGEFWVSRSPSDLCGSGGRPTVGALTINPSSLNVLGQIIYGSPVTFDLPDTTDCDGEPSNLEVTLHAGTSTAPMVNLDGIYSATVDAEYWGTPLYATVEDLDRDTSATSYIWSLPPIVPPGVSTCEADPRPEAFTVVGPNPLTNYDVASGTPVEWQIWAENCDGTRDSISADCNFGPLGTATAISDSSGVIAINLPLTQRLTGSFPCAITGSNGETRDEGAILYPPYYMTPTVAPTHCEETYSRPQVGALSITPSSLNSLGQIVLGSPVTFALPNTTDCDGDPSSLNVTLYAGTSSAAMTSTGGIYYATLTTAYWGTPVYAIVEDLARSTSSRSELWSLPPIVPPAASACDTNPLPEAFTVVGPTPLSGYDIASGALVRWQIYAENCDETTNGLQATCYFTPLGSTTASGDSSGIITERSLTERLTGYFPCDIRGSNGRILVDGARLYPPYYRAP
jgi:hypothetical protein